MNEFQAHSKKQFQALINDLRILALVCGTQWGKTRVGAVRMKLKMHEFTHPDDNFIITSPNYKTMYQSTLPFFLQIMDKYGIHDKKLDCFKVYNGGTCWFRTETDPDSVVGLPRVRHVWLDEAGKYRLYFWENILNRIDSVGGTADITTSPYALNWVYKQLIKPTEMGVRKDVNYINAASWENPYHSFADPKKLALAKATMDKRRFDATYGGQMGQLIGLVYDCFDEDENQVDPFELPTGTRFVAGVDWGFTDPFVIKVRAITPEGAMYGIHEFYKSGLSISMQKKAARGIMALYPIERFWCDPSQPGAIRDFQLPDKDGPGLPASPADNDIRSGIDSHYELVKTRRLKYFRNANPYTLDEYETYHYPEPIDLKPDQNQKPDVPVDQQNHCMDSERYISKMTFRASTMVKSSPKVPDQDQKQMTHGQRIAKLKKPSRSRGFENWS